MIWFLRVGIIMQFFGAISLSTPLVFMFVGAGTIKKWLECAESKLNVFLNWSLDKVYGQARFCKVSPDASKWEKIKQTYIMLGIMLAIAVFGYLILAVFWGVVISHSVIAIVVLAPFAVAFAALSGWVFSRLYKKRVIKITVFVFFAAMAVLMYVMLIFSVILHTLLVSIIGCIALFDSLLAWLARRRVRRVMLVSGGLLLAIGMALQFASTFMNLY